PSGRALQIRRSWAVHHRGTDWLRIAYRGVHRRGFAGADRDRALWGVDDRSCTNACHGVIESRSWRPQMWVPTALLLHLSRDAPHATLPLRCALDVCMELGLLASPKRVSQSARYSAHTTRDSTSSRDRHNAFIHARSAIAVAVAFNGKGRTERGAARTCHTLWPPGLCPRPPRLSPTRRQRATFAPRRGFRPVLPPEYTYSTRQLTERAALRRLRRVTALFR